MEVEASGFSRKMARELEAYMKEVGVDGDAGAPRDDEEEDDDSEEEEDGSEEDHSDDGQPEEETGPSDSLDDSSRRLEELRV